MLHSPSAFCRQAGPRAMRESCEKQLTVKTLAELALELQSSEQMVDTHSCPLVFKCGKAQRQRARRPAAEADRENHRGRARVRMGTYTVNVFKSLGFHKAA
ncbi:hypothetical protein NDU88_008077 [Pleurodeles waltl]|uniref:Uncharacterized protein n=1 Tax=Pleurodeles waltl TaxID=8319 RepID=A0AAV7PN62_PLEWA|nr:hypothetical protein NDU88_008077 [Pleurodeles waltl]